MYASVGDQRRGVGCAAVSQPFGNENVLKGHKPRAHVGGQGNGNRDLAQLFAGVASVFSLKIQSVASAVKEIEDQIQQEGTKLRQSASQNQGAAGAFNAAGEHECQEIHGKPDLDHLLPHLHHGVFVDPPHRGKIAAPRRGEGNEGKGKSKEPQRAHRARILEPKFPDDVGKADQKAHGEKSKAQGVGGGVSHGGGDLLGTILP